MYIVIKKDKAEKLEEKLEKIKYFAEEVMECFEKMAEERYEEEDYYRDKARGGGGRYNREDDFDEDEGRFMARGRGRSGGGGGRGRSGRY